jgi:hypothetical protein
VYKATRIVPVLRNHLAGRASAPSARRSSLVCIARLHRPQLPTQPDHPVILIKCMGRTRRSGRKGAPVTRVKGHRSPTDDRSARRLASSPAAEFEHGLAEARERVQRLERENAELKRKVAQSTPTPGGAAAPAPAGATAAPPTDPDVDSECTVLAKLEKHARELGAFINKALKDLPPADVALDTLVAETGRIAQYWASLPTPITTLLDAAVASRSHGSGSLDLHASVIQSRKMFVKLLVFELLTKAQNV